MVITWKKIVFFLVLIAVAVWAYFHYFAAAGKGETIELPKLYAKGNPVALRELKNRPYESQYSATFRTMAGDTENARVREAALYYLAKGTEPAEEGVIMSALNDPEAPVRIAACDAAGKRKMRQAVEVIIPLVDDDDMAVKGAARTALGKITGIDKYMGRSEWEEQWSLMNNK